MNLTGAPISCHPATGLTAVESFIRRFPVLESFIRNSPLPSLLAKGLDSVDERLAAALAGSVVLGTGVAVLLGRAGDEDTLDSNELLAEYEEGELGAWE